MHKLLARLVRRYIPKNRDSSDLESLFDALTKAFEQHDQDRHMLERSLMLTSDELNEINRKLYEQLSKTEASKQKMEETLAEQQAIIDSTPEAIFNFEPGGTLKQINKAGCDLLGISETETLDKVHLKNIDIFLDKLKNPNHFNSILKKIEFDKLLEVHDHFETKDSKHLECYSVPGVLDDKLISRVWCFRDITKIKESQQQLRHQAFHDNLTGLPNRTLLLESIDHAIALAKRHKKQVSVLFIDLDDFKKINDTAGHQEGDRFLIEISKKIKSVLRYSDIVGRLGGDEFLVILEDVERQRQIIDIHKRILNLFTKPFYTQENQYFVSCSIGISSYPQDGKDAEILIRKSDMAMYQAKRNGKNTFRYFDENLEKIALHRVSIETQIREAINKNEFIFHYQPKVDLNSRKIIGVEALIRWRKPDGQLIYPDNFIPIAEDTGLIRDITKNVIKSACQKINRWQSTALKNISISINISAIDFSDPSFISNLFYFIDKNRIKPNMLELELTESVFFDDIDKIKKNISKLKSKNIMLSIDDFGTGYSSFSYLHDLDINHLKIDKSFVQSLHKNKKSKSIVKSIIDLGVNLGIEVIAEGVETKEDHDFLLNEGCHIAQGYFYSRPIPEEKLITFITSQDKPEIEPK